MKKYIILMLTLLLSVPNYGLNHALADENAESASTDTVQVQQVEEAAPEITEAAPEVPAIIVPSDEEIMAKQDSTIIMTVNGTDIPKWIYDNAFNDSVNTAKKGSFADVDEAAIQKTIVHNIVDIEVLYQEAVKQGFAINEAGGVLRSKIIGGRFKSEDEFKLRLANAGMTEVQFAHLWQQQASVNELVEKKVLAEVFVTDEELMARYEEDKHKYARTPKVKASHILIKVEENATDEDKAAALAKAEALHKQAIDGADFAALATENSDCPSGKKGGDLGFFHEKKMVPEFSEVAFALKMDEISGIVETKFGYHIIKKTGEQGPVASFDEVADQLAEIILHDRGRDVFSAYKEDLVNKAVIVFHNADLEAAYARK
ncbi:MAG: peptidylprolyl isomerase [Pseudomonadota bacterium]